MTAVVIARMHIQYVVLLTSPKEQVLLEHFEKVRIKVVCGSMAREKPHVRLCSHVSNE